MRGNFKSKVSVDQSKIIFCIWMVVVSNQNSANFRDLLIKSCINSETKFHLRQFVSLLFQITTIIHLSYIAESNQKQNSPIKEYILRNLKKFTHRKLQSKRPRLFAVKKKKIADKNNKRKKINKSGNFKSFFIISFNFLYITKAKLLILDEIPKFFDFQENLRG